MKLKKKRDAKDKKTLTLRDCRRGCDRLLMFDAGFG
jgi:hypothetical protein